MSKSRSDQMVDRLRQMQAAAPEIEASAIVSVDGLIMASALPQEVEEDRVSAMSAAMLSLGERIATELGRGSLAQVFIKGEKGYVVLMSIGEDAVLTALARERAKLGLIFLDMRRAAGDHREGGCAVDPAQEAGGLGEVPGHSGSERRLLRPRRRILCGRWIRVRRFV